MKLSDNAATVLGMLLTIIGTVVLFGIARGLLSFLLDHWLLSSGLILIFAGGVLYYLFVQTETLKR